MGALGHFDLFIANVEKEGQFLKVWGQRDRNGARTVEGTIQQLYTEFEKGVGVPDPKILHPELLCCARYQDGAYYRAKILDVDWKTGFVNCIFVDYGNRDRVSFAEIRVLENAHALFRIPAQAASFILSGVVGVWDQPVLQQVMAKIGYEEVQCSVLKSIGQNQQIHLLKVYHENTDFCEVLQSHGMATLVPQDHFEVMIWNTLGLPAPASIPPAAPVSTPVQMAGPNYAQFQNQMMSMMWPMFQRMGTPNMMMPPVQCVPAAMTPIVPPAPVHVPAQVACSPPIPVDMRKSATNNLEALTRFSTITLENNSEHRVYISHCEKGSFSFSVQLSEYDTELEKLSTALNNETAKFVHLKQPYIPGTICISRFNDDDNMYRAVITGVQSDKCQVYFVDYGNSDFVKCKDLYEIPAEFTHFKVMALPFTLAGLNNVSHTDDMRTIFYDTVLEKEAILKVVPPKCEELVAKQLGHLFIEGTNVLELINTQILKKRPMAPMFSNVHLPASGSKVKVVVAYARSVDNFYVQLASQQSELESMMTVVNQYCNGPAQKMQPSDVQPGASCCALYSVDGQWYRAFIINADMNDLRVMYVDYGNEEKVTIDDLRLATDHIVAPLRAQAIPCRLSGFSSISSDEGLSARFEDLCLEEKFVMNVVQLIEHIPCLEVRLIDENGTDIATLLRAAPNQTVNGHTSSGVALPIVKPARDPGSPTVVKEVPRSNGWDSQPVPNVERRNCRNQDRSGAGFDSGRRNEVKNESSSSVRDKRPVSREDRHIGRDQDRSDPYCQKKDPASRMSGDQSDKFVGHCDRALDQPKGSQGSRSSFSDSCSNFKRGAPRDGFSGSNRDYEQKQSSNNSQVENTWDDAPAMPDMCISSLIIDVGCKKPVDIVFSTSPNDFFVHERPVDPNFHDLMDRIAVHYNAVAEPLPSSQRTVGTSCVAKYSEDDTFYRGIIKEVGRDKALIQFVDYGNSEMVHFNDLKKIRTEFLGVKAQAIHCRLKGIPLSSSPTDDCLTEFNALSECDSLVAEFVEVEDAAAYGIILKDTCKQLTWNELFGATQSSMLSATSIVSSVPHQQIVDGSEHDVLVSWLETPGRFYVQLKSTQDEFRKLMSDLQKDYKNKAPLMEMPSIGQVVVAKYHDGALYRALVKVQKGDRYGVQYVDYGNRSLVAANDIYGLENRYASLPAQAISCSLQGVVPIDAQWTKNPEFNKHFSGNFKATFKSSDNLELPYVVCLSSTEHSVNLADVLISNQLAKSEQLQNMCIPVPQDPMIQYPIDKDLLVGQLVPVLCVHVEDGRLSVSFEPEALANMRQEVAACGSQALVSLPPQCAIPGQQCLVLVEELRRAVIMDSKAAGGVAVQFMDFGGVEEVSCGALYAMPEKFMGVPALVFECAVSDDQENLMALANQNVVLALDSFSDGRFCGSLVSMPPLPLPSPILRKKTKVSVAHASGSYVWLQKASELDKISHLLDEMFDPHESGEPLASIVPSIFCAAKSEADGNWYRAEVRNEDVSGLVLVHYTDYGNDELLPVDNLKTLNENFATIPALAVKASLPVSTEDLGETVLGMADDKVFTGVFAKINQEWFVELLDDKEVPLIRTGREISMGNGLAQSLLSEPPCDSINVSVGSSFSAVLSFLESTTEFYLHHHQEVQSLEKLQSDLQTLTLCLKPFEGVPEVGSKCVALYTEDNTWYRGIVLPENRVYFMDYGNTEAVAGCSIKILPPEMEKIKPYSIKCELKSPVKKQWAPEASDRLANLLESADSSVVTVVSAHGDALVVTVNVDGVEVANVLAEEGFLKDKSVEDTSTVSYSKLEAATVAFSNSPADFYIHLDRDAETIDKIFDSLLNADQLDVCEDPSVGKICAALFPEDEVWYRARIIGGSSPFQVHFVDYGNESVTTSIRSLPQNLQQIPAVAIQCSLPLPDGLGWSDAASKRLAELVETEAKFEVEFLSSEAPFMTNLSSDGVNINRELATLSGVDISVIDELLSSMRISRQTNGKTSELMTTEDFGKLDHSQAPMLTPLLDEGDSLPDVTIEGSEKLHNPKATIQTTPENSTEGSEELENPQATKLTPIDKTTEEFADSQASIRTTSDDTTESSRAFETRATTQTTLDLITEVSEELAISQATSQSTSDEMTEISEEFDVQATNHTTPGVDTEAPEKLAVQAMIRMTSDEIAESSKELHNSQATTETIPDVITNDSGSLDLHAVTTTTLLDQGVASSDVLNAPSSATIQSGLGSKNPTVDENAVSQSNIDMSNEDLATDAHLIEERNVEEITIQEEDEVTNKIVESEGPLDESVLSISATQICSLDNSVIEIVNVEEEIPVITLDSTLDEAVESSIAEENNHCIPAESGALKGDSSEVEAVIPENCEQGLVAQIGKHPVVYTACSTQLDTQVKDDSLFEETVSLSSEVVVTQAYQKSSDNDENFTEKEEILPRSCENVLQTIPSSYAEFKEAADSSEIIVLQSSNHDSSETEESITERVETSESIVQALPCSETALNEVDGSAEAVDAAEECHERSESERSTAEGTGTAVESDANLLQTVQSAETDLKELLVPLKAATDEVCTETEETTSEKIESLALNDEDIPQTIPSSETYTEEAFDSSKVVVSLTTYSDWKSCESDSNGIDHGQCVVRASDFIIEKGIPGVTVYTFEDCESHTLSIDVSSNTDKL